MPSGWAGASLSTKAVGTHSHAPGLDYRVTSWRTFLSLVRHTASGAQKDRTQAASLSLLQLGCSAQLCLPLCLRSIVPFACGTAEGLEETKATAVQIAEKVKLSQVGGGVWHGKR